MVIIPKDAKVRCQVLTDVDYEGMNNMQCELKAGHLGFHRAEDSDGIYLWWYKNQERNKS